MRHFGNMRHLDILSKYHFCVYTVLQQRKYTMLHFLTYCVAIHLELRSNRTRIKKSHN